MIRKLGQVMLYVNNQDESVKFWTEVLGFKVIDDGQSGNFRWIEVAPEGTETSIVLQDKAIVAEMEPELNLGTPSLMFYTDNIHELYSDLSNKGVAVGELVDTPTFKVFNFPDKEENYFAVMEVK